MKNHRYLLILAAVLMLGAGCSSDSESPLAPALAVPMGGPGLEPQTRVIGPDGGCVVSGGVRLDIPAGALSAPTTIGIEWLEDGSVDLTPNGQQFVVPVSSPSPWPRVRTLFTTSSSGSIRPAGGL